MRPLLYTNLSEFSPAIAERMMMRYGSALLLHRTNGTAPPEWPVPRYRKPPSPPKPRSPSVRRAPVPNAAVRQIIADVAEAFGITEAELLGKGRLPHMVNARSVVVRLLRDRKRQDGEHIYPTTVIGAFLDRDHSTVCYALRHFDDRRRHHPLVGKVYEALRDNAERRG